MKRLLFPVIVAAIFVFGAYIFYADADQQTVQQAVPAVVPPQIRITDELELAINVLEQKINAIESGAMTGTSSSVTDLKQDIKDLEEKIKQEKYNYLKGNKATGPLADLEKTISTAKKTLSDRMIQLFNQNTAMGVYSDLSTVLTQIQEDKDLISMLTAIQDQQIKWNTAIQDKLKEIRAKGLLIFKDETAQPTIKELNAAKSAYMEAKDSYERKLLEPGIANALAPLYDQINEKRAVIDTAVAQKLSDSEKLNLFSTKKQINRYKLLLYLLANPDEIKKLTPEQIGLFSSIPSL